MSLDLRQGLLEATAEVRPDADLTARAHREGLRRLRRRRRWSIAGTSAGLALVLASTTFLALGRQPGAGPIASSASPGTSPAGIVPPSAVRSAVTQAEANGTISGPVEWVETTTTKVSPLTGEVGMPDVPIYVVHMTGNFVLNIPAGYGTTPKPEIGTSMVVFIPLGDASQGGGGIMVNDQPLDLTPYGTVHTFQPS